MQEAQDNVLFILWRGRRAGLELLYTTGAKQEGYKSECPAVIEGADDGRAGGSGRENAAGTCDKRHRAHDPDVGASL